MSRTSSDQYVNGKLENGYDYTRQAWVVNGKYVSCGHPQTMRCGCFGRIHAGEASLEFRPDLNLSTRIKLAAMGGRDAFFERIAKEFPEINSGDFSPSADESFRRACESAAREWVLGNLLDRTKLELSKIGGSSLLFFVFTFEWRNTHDAKPQASCPSLG